MQARVAELICGGTDRSALRGPVLSVLTVALSERQCLTKSQGSERPLFAALRTH